MENKELLLAKIEVLENRILRLEALKTLQEKAQEKLDKIEVLENRILKLEQGALAEAIKTIQEKVQERISLLEKGVTDREEHMKLALINFEERLGGINANYKNAIKKI